MKSDSGFYIGTTHDICEDYALSNDASDLIMVSDGCSSSPKTDIGSRLICECAKNDFWNHVKKSNIVYIANKAAQMMDLPQRCLDVTFLTAVADEEKVFIETTGDGNIIVKTKDGVLHIISMNYAKSAPYYMNYVYNRNDDLAWENIPNNDYTVEYNTITEDKLEYTITNLPLESFPGLESSFEPKGNRLVLSREDVEWVALSSDGLESFYEKVSTETSLVNKPVDYIDIIIELFQIRNTNGKFVQRRLNKFKKACAKKNWYNADDVSLAILVPGE
jgi:hypothetical protein